MTHPLRFNLHRCVNMGFVGQLSALPCGERKQLSDLTSSIGTTPFSWKHLGEVRSEFDKVEAPTSRSSLALHKSIYSMKAFNGLISIRSHRDYWPSDF